MKERLQALQRIWHSTVHRWNRARRRKSARRPFWDVLILTAANRSQARGYELELERRRELGMIDAETRILVVPDRAGKRLGSGGATLWALKQYARDAATAAGAPARPCDLFEGKRILMMHCGGEGRRVPSNAGTGKLFAPLPFEVTPGRAASPFDAMYVFLCACVQQMTDGMVLVSGDVLAVFDPAALHWRRSGVSGIGIPSALDLAARHGVYVPDASGRRVFDYPQKMSPAAMQAEGVARADGQALIDGAGILRFSPETCVRLAELAGIAGKGRSLHIAKGVVESRSRQGESIDLYTDIAWAMTPAVSREAYLSGLTPGKRFVRRALHDRLGDTTFWLDVIEESVFVHLGNLWQILDAFSPAADSAPADLSQAPAAIFDAHRQIASFVSPAVRLDPRAHVQNSALVGPVGSVEADSLVAECRLSGRVYVGQRCLLRGIESAADISLRDGVALFAIPLKRRTAEPPRQAWCIHGVEDNPKQDALSPDAAFMGMPLYAWMRERTIAEKDLWPETIPVSERTLWNAQLHPVGGEKCLGLVLWMQDRKPDSEMARAWRAAPRLSFADVFDLVDYQAGFRKRERLVCRNLLANIERDLNHRRDPRHYLDAVGSVQEFERLFACLDEWISQAPNPLIAARMLAFRADAMRSRPLRDAMARSEPDSPAIPKPAKMREREAEADSDAALRKVAEAVASGVSRTEAMDLEGVRADRVHIASPARIDFGGGWTDTPPQCLEAGGVILSAAVRLNGAFPIGALGEKIDEPVIRLASGHARGADILKTSSELPTYQRLDDPFALLKAALGAIGVATADRAAGPRIEDLLDRWGHGLRLYTRSNVPKGSGLGTSSILGAAAVACLRRLFGAPIDRDAIFRQVLYLEQLLTSGGGWQDQIGALVPGVKMASVPADGSFALRPQVEPLDLKPDVLDELNRRLVLFYVGKRRVAFNMLRQIVVGYLSGKPDVVHALRAIHDLAFEQREALRTGDLDRFGAQLTRVRMLYRLMCPATTSDLIEDIFAAASPYASGGKCIGAGGGGFVMVMARSDDDAARVRERLKEFSWRGLGEFYDFTIDLSGLHEAP